MQSRVDLRARRRDLSVSSITKENQSSRAIDYVVTVIASGEEEMWLFLPSYPNFYHLLVSIATEPYITQNDIGLSVFGGEHLFEDPNRVSVSPRHRSHQQSPFDV